MADTGEDTVVPEVEVEGSENQDATTTEVSGQEMIGASGKDAVRPTTKSNAQVAVKAEDLNRLRSTYDRQVAQLNQQNQQMRQMMAQMQEKLEASESEGLTDEERLAYEADKATRQSTERLTQAQQRELQAQAMAQVFQLKTYYMGLGAAPDVLAIEDPSEMQDAFIKGLIAERDAAKAEAAKIAKGGATLPNGKQPPTKVTTNKPTSNSGKIVMSKIPIGSSKEREIYAALRDGALKMEDLDMTS